MAAGSLGLDALSADPGFSMISLTDAFNRIPFVPQQVGRLNIFKPVGALTNDVAIEELDGSLALIPSVPRGGPSNQNKHNKSRLRKLVIPHLPLEDTIQASEIVGVREFGTLDQLQGAKGVMNRRLAEIGGKHDATVEYQRINALLGILLDADGETIIYDLFKEFNVEQQQVDLDLGNSDGNQVAGGSQIMDAMDNELGGLGYDMPHAYLGAALWKEFVTSPGVIKAFQYFQATGQNLNMNPLRDDLRYAGFMFGGVIWEKYRGAVGGIKFMPDNEGVAFPTGVDIYRTYYGPAEFFESIGTLGIPRYAKQIANKWNTALDIYTESNPLSICLRPAALIKLISST